MKIKQQNTIIEKGKFSTTQIWEESKNQVLKSIQSIIWPPDSDKFVVYPEEHANGVNPITEQFESNLDAHQGWQSTGRTHFKTILEEYDMKDWAINRLAEYFESPEEVISSPWFDGSKKISYRNQSGLIAVEWETGNISSSHRSLNRLTLGLISGIISAGIVILPTRDFYNYLTDRVGNYQELEPYLVLWELMEAFVDEGVLEIIAVEYDETGEVTPVGKLKDGMSDRIESENQSTIG